MSESADMLYVYAVVTGEDFRPGVAGIDGAALDVIGDVGPRAVVHRHSSGPFDGPDDEVRRWVLEHSAVIEDAWERARSVLPVSFNVIVRPDPELEATASQQLKRWLTENADSLSQRLDALSGASELRVEISLEGSRLDEVEAEVAGMRTEMADRPAGVRRLLEKRLEKVEREMVDRIADRLYPEVRARIASCCLEIEEYRSANREQGSAPVISASCLVGQDGVTALGSELTALRNEQPALSIRFLGPWPPYSFADVSGSDGQLRGGPDEVGSTTSPAREQS